MYKLPFHSVGKTRKPQTAQLSDDEMRRRIFANATVLFPSSSNTVQPDPYEIVYASRPRLPTAKDPEASSSDAPWQYAMLVRRSPTGDFTPLIKGAAWSTTAPWNMVLQGLLDATAAAVHRRFAGASLPLLGVVEELPRYEGGDDRTTSMVGVIGVTARAG